MKNKRIADVSIVVLVALFIIITIIKILFKNNEWWFEFIGFVIEAALVGALADWFAITALFEQPFLVGKIPFISSHTAIIPRRRDSIIDAVSNMVQNELLSEKVLKSKIKDINIIDNIIAFVDKNMNSENEIYKEIITYSAKIIENTNTKEITNFIEIGLKNKIKETDLSVYIEKGLSFVIKNNECKNMFNNLMDELIEYMNQDNSKEQLKKHIKDLIDSKVNGSVNNIIFNIVKFFNGVNSSEASVSILEQINTILLGLKDEKDPIRIEIIKKLEELLEKVHSDEVKNYIDEWKSETLEKASIYENLNQIIEDIIKELKVIIEEVFLSSNPLGDFDESQRYILSKQDILVVILWIKHKLNMYWNDFKANPNIKNKIDYYIKEFIFKFIESKYENVGFIVKKVLNNMSDDSLNNFVQQKAGNDLHGIRINGCIMGAIFGIAVFLLTHLFYDIFLSSIFNIKF